MAQLVLGIAGAALLGPAGLGFAGAFGMSGAAIGFAAGSFLGAALFPPEQPKPSIGDLSAPKVSYGAVIPYVEGHPRLPHIIAWQSDARAIENTVGGKGGLGGPEQTSIAYERDVLLIFAENDCGEIRRVWVNKKLEFSLAADLSPEDAEAMNGEPPWLRMTNYRGGVGQMPDPTYEAAVGTGFVSAMRDRHSVFFEGFQTGSGPQLPLIEIEFAGQGSIEAGRNYGFYAPYSESTDDTILPPVVPALTSPELITFSDDWGRFNLPAPEQPATRAVYTSVEKFAPEPGRTMVFAFNIRNVELQNGVLPNSDVYRLVQIDTSGSGGPDVSVGFRNMGGELHLYTAVGAFTTVTEDHGVVAASSAAPMRFRIELNAAPDPRVTTVFYNDTPIRSTTHQGTYGFYDSLHISGAGVGVGGTGVLSYEIQKVSAGMKHIGPTMPLTEPTLQEVVERQCARGGVDLADVDADDLASITVAAMAVSQITSPRNVIDLLASTYQFSAARDGGKLAFRFLGGDSVADIAYAEMGATAGTPDGERLPITDGNDVELPPQIFLKYINVDDDYQEGMEASDRLISTSQSTSTVELALGLTPTQAKRLADVTLMRRKVEAKRFGPFTVNRDHAERAPGHVVRLQDRYGNWFRARLTRKSEAQGVLTFEAVADDATVLTSAAETATGYSGTVLLPARQDTTLELLDTALLDEDDTTGMYAALYGGDGWPGAAVKRSADDVDYTYLEQTSRRATLGRVTAFDTSFYVPSATGSHMFQEQGHFTVELVGGQLYSYTRDDVLDLLKGAYLVGGEIIQARSAELIAPLTYRLSGLLRGRMGTEWAIDNHVENERFVVLDSLTLIRLKLRTGDIGRAAHYKAVTYGRRDNTADSQVLTFTAASQRPYAPVDVGGGRLANGDLFITWARRTRLSCNFLLGLVPLGETSEAYDVRIFADSGYGEFATLLRTIRVHEPQALYTAAQQAEDDIDPGTVYFDICQISSTVGRGYATRGAL